MKKEQEEKKVSGNKLMPEEQKQLDYLLAQAILKSQVRKGLLSQDCYSAICKKIGNLVENKV